MLLGLNTGAVFAEGYSDTGGHWGASVIEKWSEYEVLQGNGDGTFAPDRQMSVAELATVLTRAFGYAETGTATVSSAVPAWGRDAVQKAVKAGAISSDETGLTLTRELAAKIIANAFDVEPLDGATAFTDDGDVSDVYKPYVKALGTLGVFKGDAGKNFMPRKGFTRAEVMQVFENTVSDIVSADGSAASDKSLIVNAPGITLTGGTVKGDLIVAQGVGDGDVTLDGVTVEGQLVVYGGGSHSVNIKGSSKITAVDMKKSGGEPVRLSVSGDASVTAVKTGSSTQTIIEGTVASVSVSNNAAVTLGKDAKVDSVLVTGEASSVDLGSAEVKTVTVEAASEVKLNNAKIETVNVTETASNNEKGTAAVVDLGNAEIKTVTIDAPVSVKADTAKIETITVSEKAVKTETVTNADGTTATVVSGVMINLGNATVSAKVEIKAESTLIVASKDSKIAEIDVAADGVKIGGEAKVTKISVAETVKTETVIEVAAASVENKSSADVVKSDGTTAAKAGATATNVTESTVHTVAKEVSDKQAAQTPDAPKDSEGATVTTPDSTPSDSTPSDSAPSDTPSNSGSSGGNSGGGDTTTPDRSDAKGTGTSNGVTYNISVSHLADLTFVVVAPAEGTQVTGVSIASASGSASDDKMTIVKNEYRGVLSGTYGLSEITVKITTATPGAGSAEEE
jgi:hypothetical protein